MQETRGHPTVQSEATDALAAAALRVEAWSGESFLHPGEDVAEVLAEGRARRRALDAALAEMDAGRRSPSTEWKVEYALMLGLERVLTDKPPRLASGTELRRHQIDALAGMLAELIARHEEHADNGNGNGKAAESQVEEDEEPEDEAESEVEEESEARATRPRSSPSTTTRARSAASASAIRPRPARRSPPPASSRPPGRWASSSSRTGACSSTSSRAT